MAATIEINYFNSFWIKKMDSIAEVAEVRPNTGIISTNANSATQTITTYVPDLGYGQRVYAKDASGVDVVGFPSKV
jgi:heme-binding NEAT domain protein